MRFVKTGLILTLLAAAMVAVARAQTTQTTQPAAPSSTSASWQNFVAQFAATLTEAADNDHLDAMLADDVVVRRFGRTEREGVARLRDRASGKTAVATRAYVGTPSALAADLAADFRDAAVPDAYKRMMVLTGEAELGRANSTSSEWIAATLNPGAKDLVGVIVLVTSDAAVEHSTAAVPPPLFILLKAEPPRDGHFRPKLVMYGDPRQ